MKQYAQLKAKYPGTVLLFRLGDFYETFQEDAAITSRVLGLTLTKRNNGAAGNIPLAGFPYHALESYMPKLLRAGYRVAVCEQLEDPKFAKGIVKRDVTEVVTPGVAFSDNVLDRKRNNYLLAIVLPSAIAAGDTTIGLSWIDVSTGEFHTGELPFSQALDQILSLQPAEILVQKRDRETIEDLLKPVSSTVVTKLDDWVYNYEYAYELLIGHFKTQTLKGFGLEEFHAGVVAAGAIMNYLQETQKSNLLHIRKISPFAPADYITLDPATKRNLEIIRSVDGRDDGTLFWVLDRTQTPMGARMLKQWLNRPLKSLPAIQARLDAVRALFNDSALREKLTELLSQIGDLERLISKISTNRATPREVAAFNAMLGKSTEVKSLLVDSCRSKETARLAESGTLLEPLRELRESIAATLTDDPPVTLGDGGVIRTGISADLDELRDIAVNGKTWIANLQKSERERTGISSLKIGFNNVFGYYIEVTNAHKDKVPEERYMRKQTLSNAERFITPELKEREEKILHAEEKILALESDLFNALRLSIAAQAEAVQNNARLLATLDCFAALAGVAREQRFTEPLLDEGDAIEISEGRHPVIEKLLPPGEAYTPNDVLLDGGDNQIQIITGPNMSGKSSYLRQAGLIVLLAQIGSFVPAAKARIGIIDRIYTRVGASDNIASGESTFLVEMHEAAHIVNTATSKSLILLDEVGRGTSTFDGISIAWALTEYLHNRIGAKTLFATHYHELNELADLFPHIKNLKVEVREYGDKVIFLHKVVPGFADHSYGIQVAQMAGLPEEIIRRATTILRNLEQSDLTLHGEQKQTKGRIAPNELQLTLFEMKDDALREEINKIDTDRITPIEALQKLLELKKKISSS
jgi:DNA mismatch repair protein MutS